MSLWPVIAAAPVLVATFLLFRLVRFRGLKGALMGARILETVGEAKGPASRLSPSVVRVHKLDAGPDRTVGLEIASGESMMVIALSLEEAGRLISFLKTAIS